MRKEMPVDKVQLKRILIEKGVLVYDCAGPVQVRWGKAYDYFSKQPHFPGNSDLLFLILYEDGKVTLRIDNSYAVLAQFPQEHFPRAVCICVNLYFKNEKDAKDYKKQWLEKIVAPEKTKELQIVHFSCEN